jgi:hypothetical protein
MFKKKQEAQYFKTKEQDVLKFYSFEKDGKVTLVDGEGENVISGKYEIESGEIVEILDSKIQNINLNYKNEEMEDNSKKEMKFNIKGKKRFSAIGKVKFEEVAEEVAEVASEEMILIVEDELVVDANVIVVDDEFNAVEDWSGELEAEVDGAEVVISVENGVVGSIEPKEASEDEGSTEEASEDVVEGDSTEGEEEAMFSKFSKLIDEKFEALNSKIELIEKDSKLKFEALTVPASDSTDLNLKFREAENIAPKSKLHAAISRNK